MFSAVLLLSFCCVYAFNVSDDSGDRIIGTYQIENKGETTRVKFTKAPSGTYTAQVIWISDPFDKEGNVRLDEKNPVKELRSLRYDQIVLIEGLSYDPEKRQWADAKIYDPSRGIKVNVVCSLTPDGKLRVRGSFLGIAYSVYWERID